MLMRNKSSIITGSPSMNYSEVDDETYSNVVGVPTSLSGPRLTAIWEGGSSSVPLPVGGRIVIGRSNRCEL
jgi:hypothetical protein